MTGLGYQLTQSNGESAAVRRERIKGKKKTCHWYFAHPKSCSFLYRRESNLDGGTGHPSRIVGLFGGDLLMPESLSWMIRRPQSKAEHRAFGFRYTVRKRVLAVLHCYLFMNLKCLNLEGLIDVGTCDSCVCQICVPDGFRPRAPTLGILVTPSTERLMRLSNGLIAAARLSPNQKSCTEFCAGSRQG